MGTTLAACGSLSQQLLQGVIALCMLPVIFSSDTANVTPLAQQPQLG